jgi:hypothetical protein
MKKMLAMLAIPLAQAAMVSAFAQTPAATNPSASQSRAEVKAGASAADADKVNQFQDKPGAATAGTGTTRAEVKSGASAAATDQVNQFQDKPGSTGAAGGGKSRAEVKAERNASGNLSRGNTEVPTPGTSSQPNLKNANPMTAEQRAARREVRRQRAADRKARRASASTASTTQSGALNGSAKMPADGGAGTASGGPAK